MNETTPYLPGLSPVAGKDVRARFDGGRLSSDGGVLLLREIENGLAIADRFSPCVKDARDPASTTHIHIGKPSSRWQPGIALLFGAVG